MIIIIVLHFVIIKIIIILLVYSNSAICAIQVISSIKYLNIIDSAENIHVLVCAVLY